MSYHPLSKLNKRKTGKHIRDAFSSGAKIFIFFVLLFVQMFPGGFLPWEERAGTQIDIVYADTEDAWYDNAYRFRKEIIIDHTRVSNADQADFPVLVSFTDGNLKSVGNGGKVNDANGYDMIFADQSGANKLDHEIESYDAATGTIVMWVRIPVLSASVDTILYLYYGNSSVSSSQENESGVWNSDFKVVQHMEENPGGTAPQMIDSTSNNNDETSAGSMTIANNIAGRIDGATSFDGVDDYLTQSNASSLNFTTQLTLGMWVKSRFEAADVFGLAGKTCGGGGAQDHHYMLHTNGPLLQFTVGNGDCATEVGSNDSLSKTGFFSGYENKWTYVTATYNNGQMALYRNGVAQASKTSTITSLKSSSSNFEVGRYPDYSGFYMNGSFDEVRASSVARSADWIKTEYNNQAEPGVFLSQGMEEMRSPDSLSLWGHRKSFTIDHTKVAGDLADFPMLVNLSVDDELASGARSDGGDILFTSSAVDWNTGTQNDRLAHEIESYNSTTGSLQAWVKIPSLSSTTDTTIYMYYGNASAINQQNKPAVWDAGVKMVQHMNADPLAASPQIVDSSRFANNSESANGSMTSGNVVAGKFGNAVNFDGTDDYFIVPSNSSLSPTTEITMEAWMRSNDTWNGRSVFGKNYAYALYCHYPNMLRGYVYSSGWLSSISAQGLFSTGQWYHFAASYRPSDGAIKIYLNGQEVAYSSQSAISSNIATNAYPLWVGQAIGGNPFSGILDEVRLSSVSRSAQWISTEYNNGSDPGNFYDMGVEESVSPDALSGWGYRKAITINHANVSGSNDLENFPVLVDITLDADLASRAQASGNDILFTPYGVSWEGGTSNQRLFYEIEDFDHTTGRLRAWIKIPSLSVSADTMIYMYYGNPDAVSLEEKSGVWDSNFKMVQHMEENPGGTAPQMIDSTQNNYDGTSAGSMDISDSVVGQIGQAVSFDASNDYIDVGGANTLNSYPLTLKAWVKTSGSGTSRGIITKYVSASSNGYQVYIHNGRIKAWYFNSTSNYTRQDADADDGGLVNDGLWHQVVYRVDAGGGSIFVDGVLKNTKAWTGTAKAPTTAQPVQIGKYTAYFNGSADEIRISDTSRSADWIKTEYDNESSPTTFLSLAAAESYMDHFRITGSSSQTAGGTQTITLTAKSAAGTTDSSYTGNKTIILTGSDPVGAYTSTFTDKDGAAIPFGSSGIVTFVNGVATSSIRLYRAGNAEIEISDGVYTSSGDSAYDLDVDVAGAALDNFDISAPASVTSESSFALTLTAKDQYGNNTKDVASSTALSVNAGVVDIANIAPGAFQDDSVYAGDITVSEIFQDRSVILSIQNVSNLQTVNLAVKGVSRGVWLPPSKPDVGNIYVTHLDNRIIFDNLPASITHFAVSADPNFLNASWEAITKPEIDLTSYPAADQLYLRFRTGQGAVSDTIVYTIGTSVLKEGDIVKTPDSFDVYIIKYNNNKLYKRLILSPHVFASYQHLKWSNLKTIPSSELDRYTTSDLVKETNDIVIYRLIPDGDTGERRAIDTNEPYDIDSVYEINATDRDAYLLAE